jgi:uncharacterized protein involved in high-affinity Fe2+ transport
VIYGDTAYLLKYYVDEPGSLEVRHLIDQQAGVQAFSRTFCSPVGARAN